MIRHLAAQTINASNLPRNPSNQKNKKKHGPQLPLHNEPALIVGARLL
jgi:hypothetical protein